MILELADDPTWSHANRMIKIRGVAAQALKDLDREVLPDEPRRGRPAGSLNKPKTSEVSK